MSRVVKNEAFFMSASRKLLLQAMSWRPAEKAEKAALVVSHHYGDYSGRLDRLGGFLAANGVALIAADTQGWGKSESVMQYSEKSMYTDHHYSVRSEEQLVADFDKLTTRVMQFYTVKGADPRYGLSKVLKEKVNPWDPEPPIAPKIPVFTMGHGMGAPIVARFIADRVEMDSEKKHGLQGNVFAAPWIGHVPPLSGYAKYRLAEEFMLRYFPYSKVMGMEPDPSAMFEDVQEVVDWEKDTVIAKTSLPPATINVLKKLSKQAEAILPNITVPNFIMTGAEDTLSPPAVGEAVADKLGSENKTIIDIPHAKHDLFKTDGQTMQFAHTILLRWLNELISDYVVPADPLNSMEDQKRRDPPVYGMEGGNLSPKALSIIRAADLPDEFAGIKWLLAKDGGALVHFAAVGIDPQVLVLVSDKALYLYSVAGEIVRCVSVSSIEEIIEAGTILGLRVPSEFDVRLHMTEADAKHFVEVLCIVYRRNVNKSLPLRNISSPEQLSRYLWLTPPTDWTPPPTISFCYDSGGNEPSMVEDLHNKQQEIERLRRELYENSSASAMKKLEVLEKTIAGFMTNMNDNGTHGVREQKEPERGPLFQEAANFKNYHASSPPRSPRAESPYSSQRYTVSRQMPVSEGLDDDTVLRALTTKLTKQVAAATAELSRLKAQNTQATVQAQTQPEATQVPLSPLMYAQPQVQILPIIDATQQAHAPLQPLQQQPQQLVHPQQAQHPQQLQQPQQQLHHQQQQPQLPQQQLPQQQPQHHDVTQSLVLQTQQPDPAENSQAQGGYTPTPLKEAEQLNPQDPLGQQGQVAVNLFHPQGQPLQPSGSHRQGSPRSDESVELAARVRALENALKGKVKQSETMSLVERLAKLEGWMDGKAVEKKASHSTKRRQSVGAKRSETPKGHPASVPKVTPTEIPSTAAVSVSSELLRTPQARTKASEQEEKKVQPDTPKQAAKPAVKKQIIDPFVKRSFWGPSNTDKRSSRSQVSIESNVPTVSKDHTRTRSRSRSQSKLRKKFVKSVSPSKQGSHRQRPADPDSWGLDSIQRVDSELLESDTLRKARSRVQSSYTKDVRRHPDDSSRRLNDSARHQNNSRNENDTHRDSASRDETRFRNDNARLQSDGQEQQLQHSYPHHRAGHGQHNQLHAGHHVHDQHSPHGWQHERPHQRRDMPPPAIPTEQEPLRYKCVTQGLYHTMRNKPSKQAPKIGEVQPGDELSVVDRHTDADGLVWVRAAAGGWLLQQANDGEGGVDFFMAPLEDGEHAWTGSETEFLPPAANQGHYSHPFDEVSEPRMKPTLSTQLKHLEDTQQNEISLLTRQVRRLEETIAVQQSRMNFELTQQKELLAFQQKKAPQVHSSSIQLMPHKAEPGTPASTSASVQISDSPVSPSVHVPVAVPVSVPVPSSLQAAEVVHEDQKNLCSKTVSPPREGSAFPTEARSPRGREAASTSASRYHSPRMRQVRTVSPTHPDALHRAQPTLLRQDYVQDVAKQYRSISPGVPEKWRIIGAGSIVRGEIGLESSQVGVLPQATLIEVSEIYGNRARVIAPVKGWVSVCGESGAPLMVPSSSQPSGKRLALKSPNSRSIPSPGKVRPPNTRKPFR